MLKAGPGLFAGIICCAGSLRAVRHRKSTFSVRPTRSDTWSLEWLAADTSKNVDAAVEMYDDAVELSIEHSNGRGEGSHPGKWYRAGCLTRPSASLLRRWTFKLLLRATSPMSADLPIRFQWSQGTYRDVGKYVTVWKRIGGKWKVLADMNASATSQCRGLGGGRDSRDVWP